VVFLSKTIEMEKLSVLIVEDEKRLAEVLRKQFEEEGFQAEIAFDGFAARKLVSERSYSIIILDINLPLVNGFDLCREIRSANSSVPIIFLTALGTQENKLNGFELGADDYILKPFDFRELLARVNVFLKRTHNVAPPVIIKVANLEVNFDTKTVVRDNKKIDLTTKEFLLLEIFLKNKDKLLSREFILEHVWGFDFDPSTNIIDVYINYLRKKVDKDFEPKLIHNKFGFGFYFSENEL